VSSSLPDGAEEFIKAHLEALRRYAFVLTGNMADADDLAQIAIVKVWERWDELSEYAYAYAKRVIATRNVSRWRRTRRELLTADSDSRPSRDLGKEIRDPQMWQALQELDQFDRMVVVLHVLDGYTFGEIAEIARRPQGTVSSRYSRAVAKLRERLEGRRVVDIDQVLVPQLGPS